MNGPLDECDGNEMGMDRLEQEGSLLDLLDRLLDKGVVISGDITLSVADVDLVYLSLRALVASVDTAARVAGDVDTSPSSLPLSSSPSGRA